MLLRRIGAGLTEHLTNLLKFPHNDILETNALRPKDLQALARLLATAKLMRR